MTKQEAIKALEEGKKVTHRYFSNNEFVYKPLNANGSYVFEDGCHVIPVVFWNDRASESWENGWELYNEQVK